MGSGSGFTGVHVYTSYSNVMHFFIGLRLSVLVLGKEMVCTVVRPSALGISLCQSGYWISRLVNHTVYHLVDLFVI